jgi:predicted transposase YbfD/YdcC
MLPQNKQPTLTAHFITITDPRIERGKAHRLIDIITIAICAVIAGAEGWVDIADFGEAKQDWFRTFLLLPNGIPSHDTFGRVFSLLDPKQFQTSFATWMRSVVTLTQGQVIAIDGKTNRRTGGAKLRPLHLVSAFATANGVALGQVATDIVTRGGNYLLALKGNQGLLYRDVKTVFADVNTASLRTTNTSESSRHDRHEKRVCEVLSGVDVVTRLRTKGNWPSLASMAKVTAERTSKTTGVTSTQTRYYISSLKDPSPEAMQYSVRAHWGIENSLHWTIDMAFREDDSRIRTDNAPANMAVLRHIALNLIRGDTARKVGIKASTKKAGWNTDYLEKLLGGITG